jgi:hypothetical protein
MLAQSLKYQHQVWGSAVHRNILNRIPLGRGIHESTRG